MLYEQTTLNANGHIIDLTNPIVMGILNVTPDSFFKGSRLQSEKALLIEAERMITEGAAILDIGGMSTRPGADIIAQEEEWQRLSSALKTVKKHFPEAIISVIQ